MPLEKLAHLQKLLIGLRHLFAQLGNRNGRAHPRHNVFALGVDEIFAVEDLLPGGRIPCESHSGRAALSHVAKNHCLNVDRRAPLSESPYFRRYTIARSLFHEPNTAPIAPQS